MNATQWVLTAWIALCWLIVFGKGCAGYKQTYTIPLAIFSAVECGAAIWLVTTL